jgi:hypothetical protein
MLSSYFSSMKLMLITALSLLLVGPLKGQQYFQQKVDTKIEVTLDDKKHYLRGYEEISYTNNSPDTLRYIYMHLWPNAYKHDHTSFAEQQYQQGKTDFYYAKDDERGFIDSLQFSLDDNDVNYFYGDNTPDIGRVDLIKPLLPGQSVKITTPFRVKVPKVFSRLGHTGQAYFISQWFPKPAVYDRKGWHPIPYLDQGEFYSEIGSYDVSITLPQNYIVMGTGNLQDASENEWLDKLSKDPLPADSVKSQRFPKSADELKTIHFHEENVHDFAWFADKRFIVRKDTVIVPGSNETVTAFAAFLPGYQRSWSKGTEYLKETVRFYSQWVGPYPYKTIKAVQGDMKAGGGMEYPTVTVIDKTIGGDMTVIVHEAGHNWFYGMLASNERDHAWMDEGINSFYEQKTVRAISSEKAKKKMNNEKTKGVSVTVDDDFNTFIYEQLANSGEDQAIEQTSANFKELNYGIDVYYKTAAMLRWLEDYMGKEPFEAGMHEYFNTWKFRHPYPDDFKAAMQKHTEKSLDWFFRDILTTDNRIDFAMKTANGLDVTIKNRADMSLPVKLDAYKKDRLLGSVWSAPFSGSIRLRLPDEAAGYDRVIISPLIPDARTPNNRYKKTALFHGRGIGLSLLAGINNKYKERVWVLPALGYNLYDGVSAGLLFHNLTWPENRFKFALAPMYSFRSKTFVGTGALGYTWYPEKAFQEIYFKTELKSFHYDEQDLNIPETIFARYIKLAPSLNFTFKEPLPTSPVTRTLSLKAYFITEDQFEYLPVPGDTTGRAYYATMGNATSYTYGKLSYEHRNERTFNPFSYSAEVEMSKDYAEISLEGNIRIDYHVKKKSLYVRGYFGKYIIINNDPFVIDRYSLNSTYTADNDYLYDETYLGRSEREGFFSKQIAMEEGGFKIATPLLSNPIGQSDNWLAALNLKTDLPLGKLPLRAFLDIGTFADADKLNPSGNKLIYDGGIEFHILDVLHVYFPLVMSQDFKDYTKSFYGNKQFAKSISFGLELNKIDWLKLPSESFKLLGF